jgi:Xaa-Pro aminopeptidase
VNNVDAIQKWLHAQDLDGYIFSTADEFLNEFPPPANRELGWATGFTGSTGSAIILRESATLFLDGRYFLQGQQQTRGTLIDVCETAPAARQAWLTANLPRGSRVALDPMKHTPADVRLWSDMMSASGSALVRQGPGPADSLWGESRPARHAPLIRDYATQYSGESHISKCEDLRAHIVAAGESALLIADPEDVSWLLNVRADEAALQTAVGDWHIVPSILTRVLLPSSGPVMWFVDQAQLSEEVQTRNDQVEILPPDMLAEKLRSHATGNWIGADVARTPAALIDLIDEVGHTVAENIVSRRRWRKHAHEIAGARRAHLEDAAAVATFMAWLARTVPEQQVTELDAARQLESFRRARPAYKGPSMPLMSASGMSGALPHYVPSPETERRLNDHPIYWMDSGGQYLGGTTDNTITLALGEPEPKHILAHTSVVKGYIALATARVPSGIYGFALEVFARQPLWRNGMDYATGTGHGVGNYLNIHEGPYLSREPSPMTTAPIEADMIITNEPGFYAAEDFGVRIESHMVSKPSSSPGFIEFETISRFPIDPRLIDFASLTAVERDWLAAYHRDVLDDIVPLVDEQTRGWLEELVGVHLRHGDVAPSPTPHPDRVHMGESV